MELGMGGCCGDSTCSLFVKWVSVLAELSLFFLGPLSFAIGWNCNS